MNNPELIYHGGYKLTEALFWDAPRARLYFAAIRDCVIGALDPDTGDVHITRTDGPVGGVVVTPDGTILEAEKSGIYRICPASGVKTRTAHFLPQPTMRYNHLARDSRGRLLVDVMGDEQRHAGAGGLYQLDGSRVRCLIPGTTVANGVVLNRDETRLYFTDTPTRTVMCYRYDLRTGDVSDGRVVATLTDTGVPDGVMLDRTETRLVIAEWYSGKLSVWDIARGCKTDELQLPVRHATSTVIGGKNMDCLFVATARDAADAHSPGGGIYRIRL